MLELSGRAGKSDGVPYCIRSWKRNMLEAAVLNCRMIIPGNVGLHQFDLKCIKIAFWIIVIFQLQIGNAPQASTAIGTMLVVE